jgi:hypothetical protein
MPTIPLVPIPPLSFADTGIEAGVEVGVVAGVAVGFDVDVGAGVYVIAAVLAGVDVTVAVGRGVPVGLSVAAGVAVGVSLVVPTVMLPLVTVIVAALSSKPTNMTSVRLSEDVPVESLALKLIFTHDPGLETVHFDLVDTTNTPFTVPPALSIFPALNSVGQPLLNNFPSVTLVI